MQAQWLIGTLVAAGLIIFDASSYYIRNKRTPRVWTTSFLATRTAVWTIAWLLIGYFPDRRLTVGEIILSLMFGIAYFVTLTVLGRRVTRHAAQQPLSNES